MVQRCDYVSEEIIEMHIDLRFGLRHRKEKDILERLAYLGSLLGSLPLLEKCRERHSVECITGLQVCHADLTVTSDRNLIQIGPAACPTVKSRHLVERNLDRLVSS